MLKIVYWGLVVGNDHFIIARRGGVEVVLLLGAAREALFLSKANPN